MKLSYEEMELIRDNRDSLKAVVKILDLCVDRYKEKLLSEPLEGLIHLRLRIEGMRDLINDFKQTTKGV